MQRVDLNPCASKQGRESASRGDVDAVPGVGGEAMIDAFGALTRKMRVEYAATGPNHELHPVTDPQDGQAAFVGRFEHGLVEGELFGWDQVEFDSTREGRLRREIVAAGQEQPVECRGHFPGIGLDRQMQRKAARAAHGVGVAAIDIVVLAVGSPALTVVERERDPDSGLSHGTSIAICGMLA